METTTAPLRAPFPYFGGKRRIAARVWEALGDVRHYVEPFCGSAAVLLARPHAAQTETINDADGMVANFWRAVKAAPSEVAHHADWPVIEVDLHARHKWLIGRRESLTEQLDADPDFFDAKVAGWWVWGACAWIGDGWCSSKHRKLPHLGNEGRGIHAPSRQLPHLGNAGMGIHAPRRPEVVFADDAVAFATTGEWLEALSLRLRGVRVATGDFARVLGSSALIADARGPEHRIGVYIDPPYSEGNQQYAAGGTGSELSGRARAWCAEHERDDRLRIVLSGYAGEHDELEARGWSVVAWKTKGGYSSAGAENANQKRERLWLSPHCLRSDNGPLFGGGR
ncbi:MAG: hypothetical protein RIS45_1261 [Planctomycetota bacterium]